jgi:acyl-coenzyme A synthetase/AMP-(fatty) acid ligase
MRRWLRMTVLAISSVLWPLWVQADQPCEVVPMPCTFEALAFEFRVVDAETRQPLPDVHALAESRYICVLKDGVHGDDAVRDALRATVKPCLAGYKAPSWIEFVADLPRTSTGKIQRFRLRE